MLKLLKKPYYESINDLPMHNWLELNKGKYEYLLKPFWFFWVERLKETPGRKLKWQALYDQFIKEIGLPDDFVELLRIMEKHRAAILENIISPTNLTKTRLLDYEGQVKNYGQKEGGKFTEFVAAVEKYMGVPIDLKNISVLKFYSCVALMQAEIKAMESVRNG